MSRPQNPVRHPSARARKALGALALALAASAVSPAAMAAEEAHYCPGHGPTDPPFHRTSKDESSFAAILHTVNIWHGLLGGTDDPKFRKLEHGGKATAGERLLFRYDNPADVCDPSNEPVPFLATLINFAIFIGLVTHFGKKPLAEALKKRKEGIMADIETAARLQDQAESRLREYEGRFENMESTLAALKADYASQSEIERARVIAEAKERRTRMMRDAEFRIDQELKEARAMLVAEAIAEGTVAAERLLADKITAEDGARLADEYLVSIGKLGPARAPGASSAGVASGLGGAS